MHDRNLQSFELDQYQTLKSVICKSKSQWKHIKVDIIANHGADEMKYLKFVFYEIQFHGKYA